MTNGFVIVVCLDLLQATTRLVRRSTCITLDGFQEMLEVQTSDLYINLNSKGSPPPNTLTHTHTSSSSPSFRTPNHQHPPNLRSSLSPAIWIESLRSTLLFSSAQLLERWAPLWLALIHSSRLLIRQVPERRKDTSLHPGALHTKRHRPCLPVWQKFLGLAGLLRVSWMVQLPWLWRYHLHCITQTLL